MPDNLPFGGVGGGADVFRQGLTPKNRRSLRFLVEHGLTVPDPKQSVLSLLSSGFAEAFNLRDIENARFDEQSKFLSGEFARANRDFAQQEERLDRLFRSKAADEIGREAKTGLRNIRSLIGARGLNPNTGTAAALAASVADRQAGRLVSAQRDIALDSARRRTQERTRRLSAAFGLGQFRNQPPSSLGLDVIQDATGVMLGQQQLNEAKKARRRERKDALTGSIIGGIGSIAGAFL